MDWYFMTFINKTIKFTLILS